MVFFGDPRSRGRQRDAIACVGMALAMKVAMQDLKARWLLADIDNPPSLRMGINSGKCRVGNFGTEAKLDYTVVGSTVNLASHLESIAEPNEILISEDTYNYVKSHVRCCPKKIANPQWLSNTLNLYTVQNITDKKANKTIA